MSFVCEAFSVWCNSVKSTMKLFAAHLDTEVKWIKANFAFIRNLRPQDSEIGAARLN